MNDICNDFDSFRSLHTQHLFWHKGALSLSGYRQHSEELERDLDLVDSEPIPKANWVCLSMCPSCSVVINLQNFEWNLAHWRVSAQGRTLSSYITAHFKKSLYEYRCGDIRYYSTLTGFFKTFFWRWFTEFKIIWGCIIIQLIPLQYMFPFFHVFAVISHMHE